MRILGLIVGASALVFLCLCFFAGIFDTVKVRIDSMGPYNLVFREHKGPYKDVRFVLYDVYQYLTKKRSLTPTQGFAVYFDNPHTTKQNELRSQGGYITEKFLDSVSAPYAAEIFIKTECLIGEFPIRSVLSPMTGPMKFYPKMAEFLVKEKREIKGPVMEIYNIPAKKILYIAPLKQ